MTRIIFILLMTLSLYAETFREYKIEVMEDMNTFQRAIKPFDKKGVVGNTVLRLMEYMVVAPDTMQADMITLYYLNYKQKILEK
jgi:hypothetical protein